MTKSTFIELTEHKEHMDDYLEFVEFMDELNLDDGIDEQDIAKAL